MSCRVDSVWWGLWVSEYLLYSGQAARVPVATARALMFDKIIPRPAKYWWCSAARILSRPLIRSWHESQHHLNLIIFFEPAIISAPAAGRGHWTLDNEIKSFQNFSQQNLVPHPASVLGPDPGSRHLTVKVYRLGVSPFSTFPAPSPSPVMFPLPWPPTLLSYFLLPELTASRAVRVSCSHPTHAT